MLDENKVLEFIKSEYTWEQIIYEIIAWEGLNPWDLDVCKISDGFLRYLRAMKEMDFRVPAKYIMVAAMLLKMKSDYLRAFKEQVTGEAEQQMQEALKETVITDGEQFQINPLSIPPRREPVRGVVVTELVKALKKVLKAHERREFRAEKLRKDIDVTGDNINERIKLLYSKINSLLLRIRKKEVEFSKLVGKWEREEVVNNFVPLVHLEQQKKIRARQEQMFEEIWVSKRDKE
jgi:segregation and condensation protein A